MKRFFAIIAIIAAASVATAQTIYDFLPDANRGDVQSMYNLGVCYENGFGCSPNPSQAVYWYEKAAKAGMPEACVNLGYCYEKGIGTEQSYAQAAYYYMEAALKGNPGGQANVAYCFLNGWGCTQSLDSAEKYANLALNNPQSGSREISDARNCLAEIKKARAAVDDDDWFVPSNGGKDEDERSLPEKSTLLKYKDTKIVCYGKAFDADGNLIGTSTLTIKNSNDGINITFKCHKYDWKLFFSKKDCAFQEVEKEMQRVASGATINATEFLIEHNSNFLSFLYVSYNEGYFSITSIDYKDVVDITPIGFVVYKSNGEKLFGDGIKVDCGTIKTWFKYLMDYWKGN